MKFPDLEPVAQALFSVAESTNTEETPYVIMNRRFRHFKDVPPDEIPALFQYQMPGFSIARAVRSLPVFVFEFRWMVYLPVSSSLDDPTSPTMNNYVTALIRSLLPTPAMPRNTLGGLVYDCYMDGQGLMDEGLLQTPSLISIPIKVLTGQ